MRLFDTARRSYVNLTPKGEVTMYVCGITPYDSAHIGHAFTFLTYDLLWRRLEDIGANVRVARNITDVDEPIYVKARELNLPYLELAKRESVEFQRVMRALNLLDPAVEPRPSDHITAIADTVRELLDTGFAYTLDGDTYFDIARSPNFGAISGYPERLMIEFSKLRGGDPHTPGKRDPLDFLLWRSITDPDDPAAWDTVLGRGRPGWHIECTVMAYEHLGTTIDIHGGGTDLIFPHHECENAQSTALGREPFARHWIHAAPMLYGGEKMSKSLGNLVFVRDLIVHTDPAAVRLALMSYHYRSGGEWRQGILDDAVQLHTSISRALNQPNGADPRPHMARLRAALDNDLDAPETLRAVRDMTQSLLAGGSDENAAAGLKDMLQLLGLKIAPVYDQPVS